MKYVVKVSVIFSAIAVTIGCGSVSFSQFSDIEQIQSESLAWPRTLTSQAGEITVSGPSERILTLSAGLDEIVYALLNGDTTRMVGVSSATHEYSNIGDEVAELTAVGKDAERVLSLSPDIVIVDSFTDVEFTDQLTRLGLKVFQTSMEESNYNLDGVLTLGYLLGLEESATELVDTVNSRLEVIQDNLPSESKSGLVTSKYTQIWASGGGSTGDTILSALNLANSAAEVRADNGFVTLESLALFSPDVIFINGGGDAFRDELLQSDVLAQVPAAVNEDIYLINDRYSSVISHWNLCAVEEIAKLIYPEQFAELVVCSPFFES